MEGFHMTKLNLFQKQTEQKLIAKIVEQIEDYQDILCNQDDSLIDFYLNILIDKIQKARLNLFRDSSSGKDFYNRSQVEIFHMVHVKNLPSIIEHDLLSHNLAHKTLDFKVKDISNQNVNSRREEFHDYVPFYFNPRNAMLYSTQSRFSDNIIILGFELKQFFKYFLKKYYTIGDFGFSNGNIARNDTDTTGNIKQLCNNDFLNFSDVFQTSWYGNEEIKSKMMSEILVYEKVPFDFCTSIYIQTPEILEQVNIILNDKNKHYPDCWYGKANSRLSYFFNVKLVD